MLVFCKVDNVLICQWNKILEVFLMCIAVQVCSKFECFLDIQEEL